MKILNYNLNNIRYSNIMSVITFYNDNAVNFSKTRVFPWPSTREFLDKIENGKKVLDIGCGNGRNLFYRDNIDIIGLEISDELCDIVKKKGGKVILGNMTELPFEDNTFDYIICVAVYHHLNNNNDRKKSLSEIFRVLKSNGVAFIQVWAMEQPFNSRRKFLNRDQLVPWKNKNGDIFNRYYRIYPKGELEKEILKLESRFKIESIIYEEGNWINLLKK